MQLFLDANILFSAAISPKGRCQSFWDFAQQGYCNLLTSPHALLETERNLLAKYPNQLDYFNKHLRHFLSMVEEAPASRINWAIALGLPLKDAPILATAVESKADFLVTGDRQHFSFLYGETVEGVVIVDPATAIAYLLTS
jgi:putative PIN family toxin of toxin-antitoxin system